MHTSKAKQGIHSPLPMGRQVLIHPEESSAPSHVTVTWEDKCQHSDYPPCPPSSAHYIYTEHDVIWFGKSLVSVGSPVPAVSPPNFW